MKKKILILIAISSLLTGCSSTSVNKKVVVRNSDENDVIVKVSDETAKSIGLTNQTAEKKKVNFQIKYNGIVKTIPYKSFFIASPVNGRVLKVSGELNQLIVKNQVLAEISSQDVAEVQFDVSKEQIDLDGEIEDAKLELNLAESSYIRESKLFEDGITAKKDFLEAENKFKLAKKDLEILEKKKKSTSELAKRRLSILGSDIAESTSQAGFVEIKSPSSGIILRRSINPGEVISTDRILFEESDLSEVYLESKIYEKDISSISLGKKVTFVTEAYPNEIFHGEVNYLSQTIDPETRTVTVKAKIQNPNYELKPEMFGKMYISLNEKEALVISKDAVQKIDNGEVVYVKTTNGYKEVKVKTGNKTDGLIEVVAGLKEGQSIATKGSFWLKSELHED